MHRIQKIAKFAKHVNLYMKKIISILFSILGGLASHTMAQMIPDGTYTIVSASDPSYYITNSGDRKMPTNNIGVWEKQTPIYSQVWRVENRNGKIVLHALNYDKYVIDNEAYRVENANNISIYFDSNTDNQLWIPQKVKEDTYVLKTAQDPRFVLDLEEGGAVNGATVLLWEYQPGEITQMWQFKPYKLYSPKYHRDIPDGIYQIYPDPIHNDYFRLDNDDNRGVNGNNVHIWESFDNNAQKWRLENRNGGIVLHSMNNQSKVLDHEDFTTSNGTNVSIYEDNNTSNQLWIPEKVGDDIYILRSSQNPNFVLDWGGGELKNGSNVQLREYVPALNLQQWYFERIR